MLTFTVHPNARTFDILNGSRSRTGLTYCTGLVLALDLLMETRQAGVNVSPDECFAFQGLLYREVLARRRTVGGKFTITSEEIMVWLAGKRTGEKLAVNTV